MATLHLIHGFIGAGKTTFARKLEREKNAILLNLDSCMIAVHGTNPQVQDFNAEVERLRRLIFHVAEKLLARGADVILDDGFWARVDRDRHRGLAKAFGAEVIFYSLECPVAVMKSRTLARTAAMPDGALFIDENAFDSLIRKFEPMGDDENPVRVKSG